MDSPKVVAGVGVRLPHHCKECNEPLADDGKNFPTKWVDGKKYYRFKCRKCFNGYTKTRKPRSGGQTENVYRRRQILIANRRQAGDARYVLSDCRNFDKKHGLLCDLTRDVVEELVATGCFYCGAGREEIRIGLDRKDNNTGHTIDNVVSCCTRCNLIRGDMPYGAWLALAKGMKEIRMSGAFGAWVPGNRRKDNGT